MVLMDAKAASRRVPMSMSRVLRDIFKMAAKKLTFALTLSLFLGNKYDGVSANSI
jgi:hypothetical protein